MNEARAAQIAASFDLRQLPADFLADPYPVYRALREQEPVRLMPGGSLFLTRHADLVAVYKDAGTFSSDKRVEFEPKYGAQSPLYEYHTTSLVFTDPPAHSAVRSTIMGALTRRSIADLEPALADGVDHLLDGLEQRGSGDLIEDFAAAIPVEVIGNLLAVPQAERGPLREWSLAILGALEPVPTPEQHARGNSAVLEFLAYLKGLVAERRKRPGNPEHDVLTRLIAAPNLSEAQLLHNCIFILNAGHETTTNLIGNALFLLHQQPESRAFLLSKTQLPAQVLRPKTPISHIENAPPKSLNNWHHHNVFELAVDEFLRFEPSNQLGNRRATCAFELAGQTYPEGTLITLCIGAANRDPAVFEAPETLNLQRSPNRHLAFGFGIHQCAGLSLARLEAQVGLVRFLARFPHFEVLPGAKRSLRARFRGFLKLPAALG